jgi:hypothetical protein
MHSFLFLNYENSDVCNIAQNIIQVSSIILYKSVEKLSIAPDTIMLQNFFSLVSSFLNIEIGYTPGTI